jgi:hypothetical protein
MIESGDWTTINMNAAAPIGNGLLRYAVLSGRDR